MLTYWLQTLDEYWYEEYTPASYGFGFYPKWLCQYYNELSLCEAIESAYLM